MYIITKIEVIRPNLVIKLQSFYFIAGVITIPNLLLKETTFSCSTHSGKLPATVT
jgi:hypothetical protein